MLRSCKILLIFQLLCLSVLTFAQSNYPPCAAYDLTGKDTIRALNSFSNSLYAGIDNPVEIVKSNFNYKNILLKSNNGIIINDDAYNSTIIPSKKGELTLRIFQFDNGDTILVFTKDMNVLMVPQPYITIERMKLDGLAGINKSFFKKNRLFEVHISDDFVDDSQWFKIKEVFVGYASGKLYASKSCYGSVLTDEAVKMISNVIPGKEISFVFTIKGTGDLCVRMSPIKIKVN